jgi:hypothetical protein
LLERIKAVVAVFPGMVTVNVLVQVLSEPKSKTAIDRFALLVLYNNAHRVVKAAGTHKTLLNVTQAV